MILWLNGTFGVGKTTTAELVCEKTPWRTFDPEHVGYMLAANLRDHEFSDFQELQPWRTLVPVIAQALHGFAEQPLVAVQTVLVEAYWDELRENFAKQGLPLMHVVLDCDSGELRRRIEADEAESEAKEWRLEHIEKFEAAREWLVQRADAVIDTTAATPAAVAELVINAAAPTIPLD